jgi:ligand-binding sensor domain-containing protein
MGTNHGLIMHDPARTPSGFEVLGPIGAVVKGVAVAYGQVWVGADSGVIRAYDLAARDWTEAYTNRAPIRALCAWSNALWAATAQGLLVRAGAQSAWALARALPAADDLSGVWPLADGLWVAGRGGVWIVRAAGQPAQAIAASRDWGAVHDVCPWRGKVLVGTDRGLLVCTPAGALLAYYDRSSGLETPAISAVLADDTRLWLGTLGGGLASLDAIP